MKKSIIFALLAALALPACQKEMGELSPVLPSEGDEAELDFTPREIKWGYDYTVGIESSKAIISTITVGGKEQSYIAWESGDKLGTFAGDVNNYAGAITLGTPCTFKVKTLTALSAGDKIYAYYPYSYAAGTDPSAVKLTIPDRQTTGTAFDADAMPMAAVPYTVGEGGITPKTEIPVASMLFRNLGAIIRFKLYSNGVVAAGEKIKSVQYHASGNICGQYTADIRTENLTLTPVAGKQGKVVTSTFSTPVSVPSLKDNAVDCYMVVAPGTVSSGYVVIETDGGLYGKQISTSLTFSRDGIQPLSLNIATMTADNTDLAIAEKSFHKGTAQSFTVSNVSDITGTRNFITPAGWTASLSGTTLTVTPPASSASPNVSKGKIVILGTNGKMGSIPVRMYGINDADELAAFTTAYGNAVDAPTTSGETIAPYLENGELSINSDITIPPASLAYHGSRLGAYWLKRLMIPLNGNDHTLTFATDYMHRGGLFQNIGANVHDLKLAGSVTCTASYDSYNIVAGGLAGYISADGISITNVISDVDIRVTSTEVKIIHAGGLVAMLDGVISTPSTVTFTNCHFTGSVSSSESIEAIGGILGHCSSFGEQVTFTNCTTSGTLSCTLKGTKGVGGIVGCGGTKLNPGQIVTLDHCSFSGIINYFSGGNYVTRIGGMIGNLERGAILTNCSFTGIINADMNKKAYFASDAAVGGIGGEIGLFIHICI
ncbi:MAG: hypothetical protein K5651_00005, partial [Bacteroidales bacterium]|nr:hypothetical protein [Bacteroidales bacterium]